MIDELSKEWNEAEEDLMQDLMAWADSVQLIEHEAASIRDSILENDTGMHKGWLERMSAQIDRTIARSERRINQAVSLRMQLQTDRIGRGLNTGYSRQRTSALDLAARRTAE